VSSFRADCYRLSGDCRDADLLCATPNNLSHPTEPQIDNILRKRDNAQSKRAELKVNFKLHAASRQSNPESS
jgi:hypothetical protein